MSYLSILKEIIEELHYCTLGYPPEIIRLIAAAIVKVQVKNQIESTKTSTRTKTCCFVHVDSMLLQIPLQCTNNNKTHGMGHQCTNCKQWFCSEHQEIHKFCMYCGKKMYSKLVQEIDKCQLDAQEILHLLLLEEKEEHLYSRDGLMSVEGLYTLFCCHVSKVKWVRGWSFIFPNQCGNEVVKYCSDCNLCFCSDHLDGFCRCGKVVSSNYWRNES